MDNQTTHAEIHGHEVIDLIRAAPQGLTEAELRNSVDACFGPGARFHTCSARGMTLEQLLQFLFMRNKIVGRDGRISLVAGNACNHG